MSHHLRLRSELGSLSLRAEAAFSDTIITISGENGSGKTTLLRTIAGITHSNGMLIVDGRIWLDSVSGFSLSPQARHVGCVWHSPALLPWLTVANNIVLGAAMHDLQLKAIAESLHLDHLLQRKPDMLSTGEAQRVTLARAVYRQPAMLLLDEPFSAQAPQLRDPLRAWLQSWQQTRQIPVLIVSHDSEDIMALGGCHWRMREGRLWTGIEDATSQRRSTA